MKRASKTPKKPRRKRTERELVLRRAQKTRARARATPEQKAKTSDAVIRSHAKFHTAANDIGPLLPVKDPARKALCRTDLEAFCREYLPASFPKPFSPGHRKVIEHLYLGITEGGKFLDVVFREFGKTTLAEAAVLFASAYGWRRFVVFIGADHAASEELLDSIRKEWEQNRRLQEDFPEVAQVLDHSEGTPQRMGHQLYNPREDRAEEGYHRTLMQWTGREIVYPWIDGAPTSGVIVASRSILGQIRGMKKKMRDGTQARPDLVIVDDPQDDESATSPGQIEKRLTTINRTIVNLSGTTRPISIVIPSTILAKNDVIDQLSNPKMHPTWTCVKIPLVEKWADKFGHDLWLGAYQKILTSFSPEEPGSKEKAYRAAVDLYLKNRAEMDRGCVVSWEHAFATNEVSAIQHAYNKLIELGEIDFNCEFQGKPPDPIENTGQIDLKALACPERFNGIGRGVAAGKAEHLTAFIDVQLQSLWWIVCAWAEDFTGWVVDYGIFPEQRRAYLRVGDVDPTLEDRFPGGGKEGRWTQAFRALTDSLLGRTWPRENGMEMRIDRLAIDANDGAAHDVVCDFCRASQYPNVMPWRSRGVGAADKPFSEYHKNPGDKTGLNWRIPASRGRKSVRAFTADVNFWKTFVKNRLQTRVGDAGCLTLPGKAQTEHRLLVDHLLCEYGVQTEGRGRRLEEWRPRNPKNQENHWWDGLVACAALSSACGSAVGGMERESVERKAFTVAGADELAALGRS